MPRFLPVSFFLLSSTAAWAQVPAVAPLAPVRPVLRLPEPLLPPARRAPREQRVRLWHPHNFIITTEWTAPPVLTLQPLLTVVPGLQATPHSGAPGDWATLRLRGGSSLQGTDQPLYVIDGLPALNADYAPGLPTQAPGYYFGEGPQLPRAGANPLLALPPEDVASVTVLQGIGAARYGAQGSNGVIEITTRRGGSGYGKQPLRLRYAGYGGVQQVRKRYDDLLTARQYAELANEAWQNNPGHVTGRPFAPGAIEQLGRGTDWQAELLRPAALHSHHLTFDGSTARTRYLLSADYLDQQGVVVHSDLKRYALRLNLDQQLGTHWKLTGQASATHLAQTLPGAGAVAQALLAPPTLPAREADGSYYQSNRYYQSGGYAAFVNPLFLAREAGYDGTTRRLLLQGGVTYTIHPHFTLSGSASREEVRVRGTNRALYFAPPSTARPPAPTDVLLSELATTTSVVQLQADYQRDFDYDHALHLWATAGRQVYDRHESSAQSSPDFTNGYQASRTKFALPYASLFATYTYARRYELATSLRADFDRAEASYNPFAGSRRAPTTLLPAAELRWHLHETDFFNYRHHRFVPAEERWLHTATLWLGWGQSSNTGLLGTGWTTVPQGAFGSTTPPAYPATAAARTTQLEAGLRTDFRPAQLHAELTAYRRTTDSVSVTQYIPLPGGTGFNGYVVPRTATLRNQGLQLGLSSRWQHGRLSGTTRLAAAWQQQRVRAVAELSGISLAAPGLVVGEAPHPYLLLERLPLSALGSLRFANPDQDGYITDNDARYQGTALPTQLYTFSQSLSLQRLSLDLQLDALAGHQLLNTTLAHLDAPTGNTNGTTRLLDRWTPTHPGTDIPQARPSATAFRYDNTHPQSAAHLRLSQLTLTYALRPSIQPHPISVWAGVQNLFVLTRYRGFDPNVSSGGTAQLAAGYDTNAYPVPRTWLLGVRASF